MVALKYNPLMKVFAERLRGDGLAPKAMIAACMHKLLRQIYGVLKSRNAFDAQFLETGLTFKTASDPQAPSLLTLNPLALIIRIGSLNCYCQLMGK